MFIIGIEQHEFKADKNKIVAKKINLGSISDNSVLHYSHTLNGNTYSFALDYKATTIDKIQKINKYLMKKYSSESSSIKHVTVDLKLEGDSD